MSPSASSSSGSAGAAVTTIANGKKTIAPTTSCSWQQVTENGKCSLEPRSCYDCLNTPVTSGENCTLTPHGLCESITQYDYTQDYRRSGPAGGYPIHYNYFPQSNTTYCETNDTQCLACKTTTFTYDDNNPSKYCVGANDCVCVKVCEADNWRNEALQLLRNDFAVHNGSANASTCSIAANTSAPIYGSSSSGEISPTLDNTTVVKNTYAYQDECRWYQNQTYCDLPRSCYDCLNIPLFSGNKCMINALGYCAPMTEYDYTHDYRKRTAASGAHYFPADNSTYCEASDGVCAQCRATIFKESQDGHVNPTQFCVGENDCVCVAFCESPYWKSLVKDATCATTAVTTVTTVRFSVASIALMAIGFTILFTISLQFITIWRSRRRIQRERARREFIRESRRAHSAFGGQQLQLDGWKSMCQELISKEQQLMGDGAILTHGEGPAVVIEEGEGYRPMSPSHPNHPTAAPTSATSAHASETRPAAA